MRREPVGEDRVDDPRVLALSSVLAQISVNKFFLPSGRSCTYGVLLELEELLISSPSYRLVRIVDPGLVGSRKKVLQVIEY